MDHLEVCVLGMGKTFGPSSIQVWLDGAKTGKIAVNCSKLRTAIPPPPQHGGAHDT